MTDYLNGQLNGAQHVIDAFDTWSELHYPPLLAVVRDEIAYRLFNASWVVLENGERDTVDKAARAVMAEIRGWLDGNIGIPLGDGDEIRPNEQCLVTPPGHVWGCCLPKGHDGPHGRYHPEYLAERGIDQVYAGEAGDVG